MKKPLALLLLPLLSLSSCGPSSPKEGGDPLENVILRAKMENDQAEESGLDFFWSNIVAKRDERGRLLLLGNYDNPPEDVTNLRQIEERLYPTAYFGSLYYQPSPEDDYRDNYLLYSLSDEGEYELGVYGHVPFTKADGTEIPLDEITDGMTFLTRRTQNFTYISPMTLVVSTIVYLGNINSI